MAEKKKARGRPDKGDDALVPLSLRVTAAEIAELDAISAQTPGQPSKSQLARDAFRAGLPLLKKAARK
ncbi:hypothetical protein [Bradyrhizobium manausense]|uniref:CopG family transcriptional regulator n=1 Tax=Bradyrhizobium manausense TaxID=989370 RepID=A0A0R3D9M6_9BRAD|nr:hypothetical protein [Bradyrhizobium manausense]KRQ03263.1 hypothetical protein AOQ71_31540 [Bradyrhizobium manausense]